MSSEDEQARRPEQLSAAKRELLARRLRGADPARSQRAGIPRQPVATPERTTSASQRRMWFLAQFTEDSPVYHVPMRVRWTGAVDEQLLGRCLSEIVRRHEVLRSQVAVLDGRLVTRIAEPSAVPVPVTGIAAESDLPAAVVAECAAPFDLATGPLLRARVLRVAGRDDTIVVTMHHIVSDGWSVSLFLNELTALYQAFGNGAASPLAEPVIQYGDFARWQEDRFAAGDYDADLAYWAETLAEAEDTALPTDRPRGAISSRHRGGYVRFDLDPALRDGLVRLASTEQVTPFVVMVSAFAAVLARHTGGDQISLGTTVTGREHPDTSELIGAFANTVVLRADLAGRPSWVELLRRVGSACAAAYDHGGVPFDLVVERLRPQRSLAAHPFFQVMFTSQQAAPDPIGPRALGVDLGVAAFDLTVLLEWAEQGAQAYFEYDTDLFDHDTIAGLVDHYEQALRQLLARPQSPVADAVLLPPPRQAVAASPAADEPVAHQPAPAAGSVARSIAAIWADVLGVATVATDASFFDLGGNSLLLVQVRARLEAELGLTPSLIDLYSYPTAAALASYLAAGRPAAAPVAPTPGRAELRKAALARGAARSRREPVATDEESPDG